MDNIIDIGRHISKAELVKDILDKLDSLAKAVLDVSLKEITEEQLSDLLNLEMNTKIDTITVYSQCTRQIENFNPNSYSVTEVIDFKNSYALIPLMVNQTPGGVSEKIKRYVELKSMMYKLIAYKYTSTEEFLRNLLKESEEKDGSRPLGRFK